MLLGRILVLTSIPFMKNTGWFTVIFGSYLLLTELIPCVYVVYSMWMRLKVYKRASRLMSESGTNSSRPSDYCNTTQSSVSDKVANQRIYNSDFTEDVEMLMRIRRADLKNANRSVSAVGDDDDGVSSIDVSD